MIYYLLILLLATSLFALLAFLIVRKIHSRFRGVYLILVSCLYFISVFGTAGFFKDLIEIRLFGKKYQVQYTAPQVIECGIEGKPLFIPVVITNNTKLHLKNTEKHFLSYHLLDMSGRIQVFENPRTAISDIPPGKAQRVVMNIIPPQKPGRYQIELDMVKEESYWFSQQGNKTYRIKVFVSAGFRMQAKIRSDRQRLRFVRNSNQNIVFVLKNIGSIPWDSEKRWIYFGCRVFTAAGLEIKEAGFLQPLRGTVQPGKQKKIAVSLRPAIFPAPGTYLLRFDMARVLAKREWFGEGDSGVMTVTAYVEPGALRDKADD